MEYIVFRNPNISCRKEKFGGIVKSDLQALILGKKEYALLEKLKKYRDYNSLKKNERKIVDKLLNFGVFSVIEKTEAKKLIEINKQKKKKNSLKTV